MFGPIRAPESLLGRECVLHSPLCSSVRTDVRSLAELLHNTYFFTRSAFHIFELYSRGIGCAAVILYHPDPAQVTIPCTDVDSVCSTSCG